MTIPFDLTAPCLYFPVRHHSPACSLHLERTLEETHHGSSYFLLMRLKPDQETGIHGLPLKGCVMQTPLSPDTAKISAELFLYHEKADAWTETVY